MAGFLALARGLEKNSHCERQRHAQDARNMRDALEAVVTFTDRPWDL